MRETIRDMIYDAADHVARDGGNYCLGRYMALLVLAKRLGDIAYPEERGWR